MTDILINVDHGCIPAASIYIKRDLGLNNVALGVLGSMVFLGLTVGKFEASLLIHSFTRFWVCYINLLKGK